LDYIIAFVGHSERRQYHSETDAMVRDKQLQLDEKQSMIPIVCFWVKLSVKGKLVKRKK
jgi:triosephosphate isomerase